MKTCYRKLPPCCRRVPCCNNSCGYVTIERRDGGDRRVVDSCQISDDKTVKAYIDRRKP